MSPMPAGSEGVWVVWDADDTLVSVGLSRSEAIDNADFGCEDSVERDMRTGSNGPSHGYTLQRLPLATPEMVAVMEAAREWVEVQRFSETHRWALYYQRRDAAEAALTQAVAALDGPTIKDSLTPRTAEHSSAHDAARAAGGQDG